METTRRGAAVERSHPGVRPHDDRRALVNGGGPELSDLLSLGLTLATCLVVGFGLGWLADTLFGTFPALALAGLALGVVAACFYFYKTFKRYS